MSNYSKIYVTSTIHAPSQLNLDDVPNVRLIIFPLVNFELTQFNSVSDYLMSALFIQGLKEDWYVAKNEYGQELDLLSDTNIDLQVNYTDGQVPTYDSISGGFVPTTPSGGGGGGDSFLKQGLTATTDITITHTFGRLANVKIFENEQEVEALVTYPTGFETSKVRIQSNQAITGFAILT